MSINTEVQYVRWEGASECKTLRAEGNCYFLTVWKAVESAFICATTVIRENTDLFILLCLHVDLSAFDLFLRSECFGARDVHLIFVYVVCGCNNDSPLRHWERGFLDDTDEQYSFQEAGRSILRGSNYRWGHLRRRYTTVPQMKDWIHCVGFVRMFLQSPLLSRLTLLATAAAAARYHSAHVYIKVQYQMECSWIPKIVDGYWSMVNANHENQIYNSSRSYNWFSYATTCKVSVQY